MRIIIACGKELLQHSLIGDGLKVIVDAHVLAVDPQSSPRDSVHRERHGSQ